MWFDANYRQQYDCLILRFSKQGRGLIGRNLPDAQRHTLVDSARHCCSAKSGRRPTWLVRLGPTSRPAIIVSSSSVSA
jgi:hypothetical protein